MNVATGMNIKVGRFGRFSKYAVRACVLGMGLLVLGGCKNQQHEDQITQLNGEVTGLKEEKATLEATVNSLQQQLAARPVTTTPPVGTDWPPGDGGPIKNPPRPRPEGPVVIEVAGDVLFASGSVTLNAGGKKELDKIARTIQSKYSGHDIRVEGYTDTDPIVKQKPKFPTNEALSKARAEAVESYLASKGVSNNMTAVGRGAAKPKSTKAASRRVEIVILASR